MPYLDYNATAPLCDAAKQAWLAAQDEAWGNPASIHAEGQRARHALDQAKAALAGLLGCKPHELIVTSGGSEANALAIHSALAAAPGEVLCSAIEHSSVLRNADLAASRVAGSTVRRLPVDGSGRLLPATLAAAATAQTRLVCVQFANNEIGTLQDIPALVAVTRAANPNAVFLSDCAQGAGKAAIDLRALGVDFAAIAGHKFGAPKGMGLLYARAGQRIAPLIGGGRQQQDRRSGTEDAATLIAAAAALRASLDGLDAESRRQSRLLDDCFARIQARLPQARWVAREAPRLSNTISLACPSGESEALVARLDLAGFRVSRGSACIASRGDPSHVIGMLGLPDDLARSAIRVSIGRTTTAEDLAAFADAYVREVEAMRAAAQAAAGIP